MADTLELLNAAKLAFYDNVPAAYIVQGTSQTFANNTTTAVQFDTVVLDNWGGWSGGSPTRYTFQVAGVYLLNGNVIWTGNASGRRISEYRINGVDVPGSAGDLQSSGTNNITVPTASVLVNASVGDYIELFANQNSGGNLDTWGPGATNNFISSMAINWLHV